MKQVSMKDAEEFEKALFKIFANSLQAVCTGAKCEQAKMLVNIGPHCLLVTIEHATPEQQKETIDLLKSMESDKNHAH